MDTPPATSSKELVVLAIVFDAGLVALAVALGWLFDRPPLALISVDAAGWLWGLAATVPMVLALAVILRWPRGPLVNLVRTVREKVVPPFRACTLLDLLIVSAGAGLAEELLFRGVVQAGLAGYLGSPWIGLIVGSLAFGLAHPITRTYVAVAAVIGVYLGGLLLLTGNLLVPIVAHAAYDLIALVLLVRHDDAHRSGHASS